MILGGFLVIGLFRLHAVPFQIVDFEVSESIGGDDAGRAGHIPAWGWIA